MAKNKENKSTTMKNQAENENNQEKDSEEYIENILETEQESEGTPDTDKENQEAPPEKTLEEQLEASELALKESNDRMLRMTAEFDNYKKRMTREAEEFRKYSNEVLIKQLLTVVDNLERAIESSKSDDISINSIAEGVQMTHKEILTILEKFNVTPIECVENPFDPEFHQAVSQEETDEYPENIVIRELMKGYMLHERLMRPSMVVVSKAMAKSEKETNKEKKQINEKV